jgi:hypothetical protein
MILFFFLLVEGGCERPRAYVVVLKVERRERRVVVEANRERARALSTDVVSVAFLSRPAASDRAPLARCCSSAGS